MLSFFKTTVKINRILIAAVILFWCVCGYVHAREQVLYRGRIHSHQLNLRDKPSQTAGVVIILEKDDVVDVLEEIGGIGGWVKVRYEKYVGYVRNREQYIRLMPATQATQPAAAAAKTKPPSPVKEPAVEKEVVQKKQEIREKIKEEEEKAATFSAEESMIIEGLDEIDFTLNRARIRSLSLSEEIAALESTIKDITEKQERLSAEIRENMEYAGRRLDALYRMNMIGRLEIAGLPPSVFDFFLRQNTMKRVIESDYQLIEKQQVDMNELGMLGKTLEEQRAERLVLENEFSVQIRIMEKETQKKEAILKDIQRKKNLSLAAVAALKEAEKQLSDRIDRIQKDTDISSHSFSKYQGKLTVPVRGKIISTFGKSGPDDYEAFTFQNGIDIRTERGEPVMCIFKGEVIFAEWLKGYGNVMIVNHGEHYYSLYAHVEEMFKKPGEKVQTGEVIATAGDTGSIKGLCLHFELRHHGKPVNPLNWLKKGA